MSRESRRQYLALLGAAGVAGLAGCATDIDGLAGSDTVDTDSNAAVDGDSGDTDSNADVDPTSLPVRVNLPSDTRVGGTSTVAVEVPELRAQEVTIDGIRTSGEPSNPDQQTLSFIEVSLSQLDQATETGTTTAEGETVTYQRRLYRFEYDRAGEATVAVPVNYCDTGERTVERTTVSVAPRGTPLSSVADLQALADPENTEFPLNGIYHLADDIDASGVDFRPIGTPERPFTGTLWGNDNTISGLRIDRPNRDGVGLFGAVAGESTDPIADSVIRDLALRDVSVTGGNGVGGLVGIVEGADDSRIEDVTVTGSVAGEERVGGVFGATAERARADYLAAEVAVEGVKAVGGVVGANGGEVTSLVVDGEVSAADIEVGGIAGSCEGQIQRAFTQAAVSTEGSATLSSDGNEIELIGACAGGVNGGISDTVYSETESGQSSPVGFSCRGCAGDIFAVDPEEFDGDIPFSHTEEYWRTAEGTYPTLTTLPGRSDQTVYELGGLMRGGCPGDETETVPETTTTAKATPSDQVSDGVIETADDLTYVANHPGEFTDVALTIPETVHPSTDVDGYEMFFLSTEVPRPLLVKESNSSFPELQTGPEAPSYRIAGELERVDGGSVYVENAEVTES